MKRELSFEDPLVRLRGVGKVRADRLASLGIRTVGELLMRAPRGYEDRGMPRTIAEAKEQAPGTFAVVRGSIIKKSILRFGGRVRLRVVLEDPTTTLEVYWFQATSFSTQLAAGQRLAVSGRLSEKKALLHPEFQVLPEAEAPFPGRLCGLRPLYGLTEGISSRLYRDLVERALGAIPSIVDPLPDSLRREFGLLERAAAFHAAHRSPSGEEAERGQERLLFDEILAVELALLRRAAARPRRARGGPGGQGAAEFLRALPFKPTESQHRAVGEIVEDLASSSSVERLLVGEVGAGKTVVAFAACEEARQRGLQAAFVAPTALLAAQHLRTARELLPKAARIETLTGELKPTEARRVRERIARGEVDLVVGTHAVFSPSTRFRSLGLAVIDEQHRFGVNQRDRLASLGRAVTLLGMSATPIPRSLALLSYPGWEISTIDGRPGSRGEVVTRLLDANKREEAFRWIEERTRRGEQALFIRPRIDGEEDGAQALYEEIRGKLGASESVGLVHGRVPAGERDELLARFSSGALSMLVATTILEVGIDVPHASILWVDGADRLGLAQLHQLRGRIARRGQRGYCFLVPTPGIDLAAHERLRILCSVADGFRLATIDLAERGPGELLGEKQSGELGYRAARGLSRSAEALTELLERARAAARVLLGEPSRDPPVRSHLRSPKPPPLVRT